MISAFKSYCCMKLAGPIIKLPPNWSLPAIKFNMPAKLVIQPLQSASAVHLFYLLIKYKLWLKLYTCSLRIADSHINNSRIDLPGEFITMQSKMRGTGLDIIAILGVKNILFPRRSEYGIVSELGSTIGGGK